MCETRKEESGITLRFVPWLVWVYDDFLNWDKGYGRRKRLYGEKGNDAFTLGYIEFEVSMIHSFERNGG